MALRSARPDRDGGAKGTRTHSGLVRPSLRLQLGGWSGKARPER